MGPESVLGFMVCGSVVNTTLDTSAKETAGKTKNKMARNKSFGGVIFIYYGAETG